MNSKAKFKGPLPMTDADIVTHYRQAKNPDADVQILSDLCDVKPERIIEILERHGYHPKRPAPKGVKKENEADKLRMEMYRSGMTDKEISKACHISTAAVSLWRRNHDLLPNKKSSPRSSNSEGEPPSHLMGVLEAVSRSPDLSERVWWRDFILDYVKMYLDTTLDIKEEEEWQE